jgi:hypothetical protein
LESTSLFDGRFPVIGLRKFVGVGVVALTLSAVVAVTSAPASAASKGTGIYACTDGSGVMTFSPPWSNSATGTVTATISFTASSCTGGSPTPNTVNGSGTVKFSNGFATCGANPDAGARGKLKLTYNPKAKPSKLVGSDTFGEGDGLVGLEVTFGHVTGSYKASSGASVALYGPGTATGNCTIGITAIPLGSSAATPTLSGI